MSSVDGTPKREAIVGVYSRIICLMVTFDTAFMPVCLLCVFCGRTSMLDDAEEAEKQTKEFDRLAKAGA